MLDEITDGVERISGLLASAKQYTQMDRAPLQTIDVHEGLDATLDDARPQARQRHRVVRDFDRTLPRLVAYAGELNQVWTNLIDNAIDADGPSWHAHGAHTSEGDDRLAVEIGDTGRRPRRHPQPCVRPFFTTKEIGKGTGPAWTSPGGSSSDGTVVTTGARFSSTALRLAAVGKFAG